MAVRADVAQIDAEGFELPEDEFLHPLRSAKEIGDGAIWRILLDDVAVDETFLALGGWFVREDVDDLYGFSFKLMKLFFAEDIVFFPRTIKDGDIVRRILLFVKVVGHGEEWGNTHAASNCDDMRRVANYIDAEVPKANF